MAAAKKVEQAEQEPKKFRITSPVERYVGIGAGGVQFAYGRGEGNECWHRCRWRAIRLWSSRSKRRLGM